ncbi:zinc-binding dehydrogenase [Nocardia stercoris]|uniref:NADPH:quinone oxidoreductase family protein n=1 Tax=Nocardia stercoris TaxID=2483361 RepID=A0A3M2KW48_9NOCA|nr:zinc-binding dehydrogenase [Nocardia stercoris]RMI29699.1 NADPH:quinone oxidoreductase family protein [Nocardia stercoris]
MTVPTTMHALRQRSADGPEGLTLITDAPVPVPGPGEILIRVAAAGINFRDVTLSRGDAPDSPPPPYLAGFEGAGTVVALGPGVTAPDLGARVVGVGSGAFAQYMVLPAAGAVPVPAGWTAEQALGLVVNWPTALAALVPLGRVAAGETVLVQAAAGGTGQAAVRLAKHYGATVVAAASPGKHETVRALGADYVIDSRRTDLAAEVVRRTDGQGADLVLESAGGASFAAAVAAAKPVTGRVVVFGTAGGDATISNRDLVYRNQIQLTGFNVGVLIRSAPRVFGEVMSELFGLVAAGVIPPGSPTGYDLADGPKVLAELESRTTVGKLALRP